jgi:hypothetical protein
VGGRINDGIVPDSLCGYVIEAPWLVNGGHGASLRHHIVPDSLCGYVNK